MISLRGQNGVIPEFLVPTYIELRRVFLIDFTHAAAENTEEARTYHSFKRKFFV